jgi:hypothetical protein
MFTSSMFQSIKEALTKSESSGGGGNTLYKEILKFKAGNTYVLRLLPNIKEPENTFYHFFTHGWNSFATGQYVSALSLQTIGKADPIGKERYRLMKFGSNEEKEKIKAVKWQEQWYVNVYVVDDPVNPENNGTVKIFRYGKKLNKLIESAISGDDSDEFGAKVFDLSSGGVNLKLKVEKQGEYIAYDSSRFTSPVDLGLSEDKQQEIYGSLHDLKAVNPLKTEEELLEMWRTHFLCEAGESSVDSKRQTLKEEASTSDEVTDEMVADLLKGLETP